MQRGIPSPQELRADREAAIVAGQDTKLEWEVAFHEAGHVVVEVATGSYPDEVYLNDGLLHGSDHAGRTAGRTFVGLVDLVVDGLDEHGLKLLDRERRRYAAVLAAGGLATALAMDIRTDIGDQVSCIVQDEPTKGTDDGLLRGLVYNLTVGAAETWLEEVFAASERLLRERWVDVERVAAALVERRRLSREEIWTLMPQ